MNSGVSSGHLRVYLGAAPGVGKTFAMLSEGVRRHERGAAVILAQVDVGRRRSLNSILDRLPQASNDLGRASDGKGVIRLDVEAVLAIKPAVALVDDLAAEWEGVSRLLAHGIDVVSTIGVHSIESLADVMTGILGERPSPLVPDSFLRNAEQVELVDMTPEALLRRIAHGSVFEPDDEPAVVAQWSQPEALRALRRHALLWLADGLRSGPKGRDPVVVAVTGAEGNDVLIRRAARMALTTRSDLIGVHVTDAQLDLRDASGRPRRSAITLESHQRLLEELGGTLHEVSAESIADGLVRFAASVNASQLVMGASRRSRLSELTSGSTIREVLQRAKDLDVHVIPNLTEPAATSTRSTPRPALQRRFTPQFAKTRVIGGFGLAAAGLVVTIVAAHVVPLDMSVTLSLLLLLVVATAIVGGRLPAFLLALIGPVATNWFLIEPRRTFRIADRMNMIELLVFAAVALLTSSVVSRSEAESSHANRLADDAEWLSHLASQRTGDPDNDLRVLTAEIKERLNLARVEVRHTSTSSISSISESRPTVAAKVTDELEFVGWGSPLHAHDQQLLPLVISQLRGAAEAVTTQEQVNESRNLREADSLKLALLQTVSHDFRTPLAAIKASVGSLRDETVIWEPEDEAAFLESIEQSADRLDRMVANTLDFARLESGTLAPALRSTLIEEVLPASIASLGIDEAAVDLDIPAELPAVRTDPALLERICANLIGNAVHWSPPNTVRVTAARTPTHVRLLVIDRGPGISPAQRMRAMEPFERIDDQAQAGTGIGLGLAIAGGLSAALECTLHLRDTPGGGLTAEVDVPLWSDAVDTVNVPLRPNSSDVPSAELPTP